METKNEEIEVVICFACNEEISKDDAFEFEGRFFCIEEEANNYVVCRDCGEVVHKDDARYDSCNNDYICDRCFDYGYVACEDCGEIIYIDDSYSVDDDEKIVCSSCINDYYKCDDCGKYFTISEVYTDDYGHIICERCYDYNDYYTCSECGEISQDAVFDEKLCQGFCVQCYNEKRVDSAIIKPYDYKPNLTFYKNGTNDNDGLFMGVELEVDSDDYNPKTEEARRVQELLPHVYCKRDGSLNNGFENVTHPCTLGYHMKADYKEAFEYMKEQGLTGHDNNTCGLHVHVNRDYLGLSTDSQDLTIAKIMLILDTLWEKGLVSFTRRQESELSHWAKRCCMEDIGNEEEEIVCKSKQFKRNGRYYAVNLQNTNTVEFRIFKSTLNYNSFIATLQFVSNIVNYAVNTSLLDLQGANISMSTISNYAQWDELNRYMEKRDIK